MQGGRGGRGGGLRGGWCGLSDSDFELVQLPQGQEPAGEPAAAIEEQTASPESAVEFVGWHMPLDCVLACKSIAELLLTMLGAVGCNKGEGERLVDKEILRSFVTTPLGLR